MKLSRFSIGVLLIFNAIVLSTEAIAAESIAEKSRNKQFQLTIEQTGKQAIFVKHLLETSSLAEKLKSSSDNDNDAQSLYRTAKELYQNALDYIDKGNSSAAAESLHYAKRTMFKAVKLLGKSGTDNRTDDASVDETERRIFNLRLQSVNALLGAIERIGDEKHISAKTMQVKNQADAEIANAVAMMNSGDSSHAQKMLNTVYLYVKTNISELRSGDTLVRSLNFKTRKDEYLYELDRNDTHKMLMTLLVKEKLKDPLAQKRAKEYLDQANELRKQAEEAAKKGDYEQGIRKFEESTRQIIRAIRRSGFFIPG